MKTNSSGLVNRAVGLTEEIRALKKEVEEFKKNAMGGALDQMFAEAKTINGVTLLTRSFKDYAIDDLRKLSDDVKKEHKNTAMAVSYTHLFGHRSLQAPQPSQSP